MSTIVIAGRAGARGGLAQQALARAAAAAAKAPALGQARALRWRLDGDRADLFVQEAGPLPFVAGGAALAHACVALAGLGVLARCDHSPDGPLGPVATLLVTGFAAPGPAQIRGHQAIALPPVTARPGQADVPPTALTALRRAVTDRGAGLRLGAPDSAEPGVVPGLVSGGPAVGAGWLLVGEALSALTLAATMQRLAVRVSGPPAAGAATLPVRIGVPGRA